jgi:ribosomal protein L23
MGEKAANLAEKENTLVFVVDIKASKPMIKKAISDEYGIKPIKIRTMITPTCKKKAYVKLGPKEDASKIAAEMGVI